MRVTNKMLSMTVLNNLGTNLNRLQRFQDQMSSGQIISRPSDDPVIGARVLTLNSVIRQHEQYDRNTDDALSWLETSEKALGSLTDVLQRIRELTISGANGALSPTDREAIAKEVGQLAGNAMQIANTSFANRYIFAGTKTIEAPFAEVPPGSGTITYSGNTGKLEWEISQGITITVNFDGGEAFNPAIPGIAGDPSIFSLLKEINNNLMSGNTSQLSGPNLGQLDKVIDHVLNLRASAGARSNRLEMAQDRFAGETINYKALKSKLNDVDLARLVTEFKMQENVYQAALSTSARIIQPSLVDFLR